MSRWSRLLQVTRDVTVEECPWLEKTVYTGHYVWEYLNYTYGCITDTGIAVSEQHGRTPFYELPKDALSFKGEPVR